MATVIRIKRPLEKEPQDTLVLNCKRRKPNDQEEDHTTLLKFAGTVSEKENIISHIKQNSSTLEELKAEFKKHQPVNLTEKLRDQQKEASKINRYKIVNCLRNIAEDNESKSKNNENVDYTIYEVEEADCNLIGSSSAKECLEKSEEQYVYDLYYTTSDHLGDGEFEEYIDLHPYSSELVYGSRRDNGIDEDTEESDDSNAENYFKNDYPDESDVESINESDMVEAMKNVNLGDDLSSDDGEEGFVYSVDSEAAGFEEDIDESDVRRYGEMYARFKARTKKVVETSHVDFYYGDIDEDEYYY